MVAPRAFVDLIVQHLRINKPPPDSRIVARAKTLEVFVLLYRDRRTQ